MNSTGMIGMSDMDRAKVARRDTGATVVIDVFPSMSSALAVRNPQSSPHGP